MKRRELIIGGARIAAGAALWRTMPGAEAAANATKKAAAPHVLSGHIGPVSNIVFSPDGSWLLASAVKMMTNDGVVHLGSEVRLWDMVRDRLERVLLDSDGQNMFFAPNGKALAVGGNRWKHGVSERSEVQLWDTSAPDAALWTMSHKLEGANAAAFSALSPDGHWFVSGISERESAGAQIWDVTSGKLAAHLADQSGFVAGAAFSPDGDTLITASWKGNVDHFDGCAIQWWNTGGAPDAWELRRVLEVPQRLAETTLSPDGKILVWIQLAEDLKESSLIIADAVTGEARREIKLSGWISHPRWSPDGLWLALSQSAINNPQNKSDAVQLYDSRDWSLAASIQVAARKFPIGIAFSPDGQTLAIGSGDNTVELHRLEHISI